MPRYGLSSDPIRSFELWLINYIKENSNTEHPPAYQYFRIELIAKNIILLALTKAFSRIHDILEKSEPP